MFRAKSNQQRVITFLTLVTAMLMTVACGRKKSSASSIDLSGYNQNVQLPSSSLASIDLYDQSGGTSSAGSATQPSSGVLVQPNPGLNNMTPWNWFNTYLPPTAQQQDSRAVAYSGQVYRFGFGLQVGANAQYQVSLPQGVQLANSQGCSNQLYGPMNGPVNLCLVFTQPTQQNNIQPIQIQISGQAFDGTAINISRRIWVLVLPGAPEKYDFVVIGPNQTFGLIPPVVNRLFVNKTTSDAKSTRETIPSRFEARLVKDNQPVMLANAQYSIEPANAGRILGVLGGQIQVEMGLGGKAFIIAKGIDQSGREITAKGELAIPRQIALKYTRRDQDCVDDDDSAVLFCSNSAGIPYVMNANGGGAMGGNITVAPGAFGQQLGNFAPIKEGSKWLAAYTLTVDGNQPNGGVVCEAAVISDSGKEKQRFVIPGL